MIIYTFINNSYQLFTKYKPDIVPWTLKLILELQSRPVVLLQVLPSSKMNKLFVIIFIQGKEMTKISNNLISVK